MSQSASGDGQFVQLSATGGSSISDVTIVTREAVRFPICFQLPHHSKYFRGRDRELTALHEALTVSGRVVVTQAIAGLGGVGKTELAAQYAHAHRDEYDIVAWIETEDGGILDLAKLAARLGIATEDLSPSESAAHALDRLAACPQRWLLVLDNVRDPQSLDTCCPSTGNGCVLITTRHRGMDEVADVLNVDALDVDSATDYLVERTQRPGERDAARALAEALGGLPLALTHAAGYCKRRRGPGFADYHALLTLPASQLFDARPEAFHQATVASTWMISIQAAEDRAPLARAVLAMAAYLAPTAIPPGLFDVLLDEPRTLAQRKQLEDALNALDDYSLIDAHEAGIDVHRLVQKVVRDDLHDRADRIPGTAAALALVTDFPGDSTQPADWPVCEMLHSHILALSATDAVEVLPEEIVWLLLHATVYLLHSGDATRAISTATTAHQLSHARLGPEHDDTLTARSNLAAAYSSAGRIRDAIELEEAILADRERLQGTDLPSTIRARANLAASYSSAGRIQDAINLQEAVLADSERLLGPEHPAVLRARSNLASVYESAGRTADAIELQEAVVTDSERLLGLEYPTTLTARANLATFYCSAGRTREAIALQEALVADRERLLGPEHPDTLTARANLASSYHSAGLTHHAMELGEAVVADRERLLGPEHPDTLTARANLAGAYHAAGRTQDAIDLEEAVLADRERLLGIEHLETIRARGNLAGYYHATGRTQDAIDLEEAVLADRERLLGIEHPDTLTSRSNLAHTYRSAGRMEAAVSLHEAVLAGRERVLGPDHPDTLITRANLAGAYLSAGRTEDAIALEEAALAGIERVLGPDHPDTIIARANLAHSYWSAGRMQDAVTLQETVAADAGRLLGRKHPNTFTARANLAGFYRSAGRTEDALALQETIRADREQ